MQWTVQKNQNRSCETRGRGISVWLILGCLTGWYSSFFTPAVGAAAAHAGAVPMVTAKNSESARHGGASSSGATVTAFSADSAECKQENDNSNVCVYSGNASFTDQDARLSAAVITVYRDADNQIVKIIEQAPPNGKAYYVGIVNAAQTAATPKKNRQDGKGGKAKDKSSDGRAMEATANAITLYPAKSVMVLEGAARIFMPQGVDEDAKSLDANADKITVYSRQNLIVLDGKARAVLSTDTITGSHLEYDLVKKVIFSRPQAGQELTTAVVQLR